MRCRRTQQLTQLRGRARIETAPRTAREARDLAIRRLGDCVVAFLKHEAWHIQQAKFACGRAQRIDILFHRVANKDNGPDTRCNGFATRVRQHAADLGLAALTLDCAHELGDFGGVGNPWTGPAFVQPTKINQPLIF